MGLNMRFCYESRQRRRAGRTAVLMANEIDMATVQNLPALFCCVQGKDNLRHFSSAWRSEQAEPRSHHLV